MKNIITKIVNWYNTNKNLDLYVKADYYNGSHNDAENAFIELKKLINGGHNNHSTYFYKRLEYLVNEGIDITSEQTATLKAVVAEEVKPATKKATKKVTKPTKVVKKVKKASMPKRDKSGRFIARR